MPHQWLPAAVQSRGTEMEAVQMPPAPPVTAAPAVYSNDVQSEVSSRWSYEGLGKGLRGSLTPVSVQDQSARTSEQDTESVEAPRKAFPVCTMQTPRAQHGWAPAAVPEPRPEPLPSMPLELRMLLAEQQLVLQAQHNPTLALLEGLCLEVRTLQATLDSVSGAVAALDSKVAVSPTAGACHGRDGHLRTPKSGEYPGLTTEDSDFYKKHTSSEFTLTQYQAEEETIASEKAAGMLLSSQDLDKKASDKSTGFLSHFEIFHAETSHLGDDWMHKVWTFNPMQAPTWKNDLGVVLSDRRRVLSMFSLALIVSNALFIGGVERYAVQDAVAGRPMQQEEYLITESVFLAFMVVELGARCRFESSHHSGRRVAARNLFEVFIIVIGVTQIILQATVNSGFRALNVVRLLRLFRLSSILRLRTLSVLTDMIRTSMRVFCWAMVAMWVIVYIYAIFVSQALASAVNSTAAGTFYFSTFTNYQDVEEWEADVLRMYGNVETTMCTLFGSISGGIDWLDAARPLFHVELGSAMYFGFIFFVFSVVYCLSNILIAAMVEAARDVSRMDREVVIQNQINAEQAQKAKLAAIFQQVDTDDSDTISRLELTTALRNPDAMAYLQSMGVSSAEVWGVFNLMEKDEHGNVELHSFIRKIFILRGTAKNVDLVSLIFAHKRSAKVWDEFQKHVARRMDCMTEALQQLAKSRRATTPTQLSPGGRRRG